MKKIMATLGLVLTAGAIAIGATGCASTEKTIEVLVQTADHGWTGAVQSYAQEKVAALNKEGKYKVNLTACENATVEANKVEELLTHKDSLHGIVLLPIDNTMEAAVTKIAAAEVPFVQFDRVITTDAITNAKSRVANVLGDNYGIGKATAETFAAKGIKKTDKILIMPGDNSSVPVSRTAGFQETLATKLGITVKEVKDMCTETDYTGWSRTKARELFVGLGDKLTNYNWIFTHDSEIAMGILEELKSNNVSDKVKTHFKTNVKSIASSSGLDEMYAVLENDHKAEYAATYGDAYLFDVTYDPAMIQIAIDDMVGFLNGKAPADKNHVVPVNVVDAANVKDYRGFGAGNYRK